MTSRTLHLYTTLFRSQLTPHLFVAKSRPGSDELNFGLLKPFYRRAFLVEQGLRYPEHIRHGEDFRFYFDLLMSRSEEHTSELQSRRDIGCRLLLEKKNTQYSRPARPTARGWCRPLPPCSSPRGSGRCRSGNYGCRP